MVKIKNRKKFKKEEKDIIISFIKGR